jgi:hypothetical protein
MAERNKFMKSMLSNGDVSVKRVIGFLGFVCLLVVMFINALYPKTVAPVPVLVNAIEYIVIAALFGTSIEKFANRNKQDDSEQV